MAQKPAPGWMTQAQMARSCGVSLSAFQKWQVPPRARIGRHVYYIAADVLENRIAHQQTTIERQLGTRTPDRAEREESLRLTRAKRDHQELVNEQVRAAHAPTALLEWVIEQAGRGIARTLGSVPTRLKRRLPKLTASDIEVLRRELRKAQRAALEMRLDLDEFSDG